MGGIEMIGKSMGDIERENGFDWYVEFKPRHYFGVDLGEHKELMEVFVKFLPKEDVRVLKLREEVVEEVLEMSYDEVLGEIGLLGDEKGRFYDGDDEVSYSVLADDFFVIVQGGMIFWSSGKELAFEWAKALGEGGLYFYEPDFIGEREIENRGDEEIGTRTNAGLTQEGGGDEDFWEGETKVNGVWVDDESGEVLDGE